MEHVYVSFSTTRQVDAPKDSLFLTCQELRRVSVIHYLRSNLIRSLLDLLETPRSIAPSHPGQHHNATLSPAFYDV